MKKNNLNIASIAMLALALMASFTMISCDLNGSGDPLEIAGTWEINATWVIDENTFTVTNDPSWNWDYSGEIISYNNDSYNAVIENPTSGDFGCMIIKYTSHTGDSSYIDTFSVVRWKELTTLNNVTTLEFSEGFKFGANKFTTSIEAEAGATEALGYFSTYNSATKQ